MAESCFFYYFQLPMNKRYLDCIMYCIGHCFNVNEFVALSILLTQQVRVSLLLLRCFGSEDALLTSFWDNIM